MSQIDLESFHRLEEFPSFISCICSFGRSIIPPLITPHHVHELRELRAAAVNKEAEILRRKKDHLNQEMKDGHTLSMLENDQKSDLHRNFQESCALQYPSYFNNREVSVAISKFPTSGIYSSVHTDAIVCSNVVGDNHRYNSNVTKDDLMDSGTNIADCIECSHSNMNLECSLCLAELNQNFCSKSFPGDLSPEVPCRTFSLLQHGDTSVMGGEINATVEEAECESLPTVICNQKNLQPDTDSESNATCMTQSTDLEKYMELSCEFSSPDNSAIMWDSKTASQQCTLSRSDDASSETIVNTENELTPCASTMAELTDNIEDEFSNAEEVAGASDSKEVTTGGMKRAHSVDSYMKILQNCGILNVKKSQSEPINTNKASVDINDAKTFVTSKTNLLIKEDSKESEEAKDLPERDDCAQENVEFSTRDEEASESEPNKNNSFQVNHVRRNSYTLDEPSSALILAHADCTCNFDAKCISPHCSALKDTSEVITNSAFVKEKVDISASPPHMKMLPVLNSDRTSVHLNKEEAPSAVVDVFPKVKEDSCEKSDSGNTVTATDACAKEDSNLDVSGYVGQSFLEDLNLSNQPKHVEFIQRICEELKTKHELKVKELHEKQNRQWLELEEEFKQQETLLFQKIIALESSRDDPTKNNLNCSNDGKPSEEKCVLQNELSASHSLGSLSDKFPTSDSSSSTQASTLSISNKCSPSSLSPPEVSVFSGNARALSPSKECMSPDKNPSTSSDVIQSNRLSKNSCVSVSCLRHNKDPVCTNSESEVNCFSHPATLVPRYSSLPEYRSAIAVPIQNDCDKVATRFCDNTVQPCRCCTSFNGCPEYAVNSSPPYSMYSVREQNSISSNNTTSIQPDSTVFKKQSPCSGIENGSHSANFSHSRTNVVNLSKISNDCIFATQKDALPLVKNGELSNVQLHDKNRTKSLPQSINEKFPIDNLESVCAKASKNGSCRLHHETLNKRISNDPILLKKFEKLPAFVKGYLTRCLLKTVYVQGLINTFKDTAVLIGKQREDTIAKGDPISQTEIDFQKQLIVLLMTTYETFYDTFFTISTKDRMAIISECRKSKMKQEATLPVAATSPEMAACKITPATIKSLERRKRDTITIDNRTYNIEDLKKARSRSALDMRTYTIDDLPTFRGRAQSSMSSKSNPLSPSSIYKNSLGMKRKTAGSKSSGSKGCVTQKWVP